MTTVPALLAAARFAKYVVPFISSFSAIRLFLALRLTSVRLMAHVTIPLATMRMVAPSTIHPPHPTCGTNNKISTRKASNDTRSVGNVKINNARRYRGE